MKIAVISAQVFPCPPPGYSGLEMIAWQIARGLVARKHDVSLIAPEGSWLNDGKIIATGKPGTWDESQAYNSYWQKLPEFDAIIDHSWSKFSYMLKMEDRLKAPVLGVMHAPVNTMYQQLPSVEKLCMVCISKDMAAHFEAFHGRPAEYAYNGIDLDFYKPIQAAKRSKRFLFLARFSTIKGPDIAIESCRKAGVGLDLIGDTSITQEPEYFKKCKEMCDGIGIRVPTGPRDILRLGEPPPEERGDKAITMIGPAKRGECVWWYSQAHCFLHPNQRFREPFGLGPVEAQACGCPVIAWDFGAMRETVKNLETGMLVKTMDEFVKAVKIYAKEREMPDVRTRCREWASQFSVENMAKRYEELCQKAIEVGW